MTGVSEVEVMIESTASGMLKRRSHWAIQVDPRF